MEVHKLDRREAAVALCVALSGLAVIGCGGGGVPSANVSADRGTSDLKGSSTGTVRGGTLLGDQDDDDIGIHTTTKLDSDVDYDNDSRENAAKGYYDEDDNVVRNYGRKAAVRDRDALTVLVGRFLSAAARGDGAGACALIYPPFAAAIPEDYGRSPGPLYLRSNTCAGVVSRLAAHEGKTLLSARVVTSVREDGNSAYVLLGSGDASATYVMAKRVTGKWTIDSLLDIPLP